MPVYLRCSALTQKRVPRNILSMTVDITFSVLMFQISTGILLLKIKALSLYISTKNKLRQTFLIIKFTCSEVLYDIFKYIKIMDTFLFILFF